VTTPARLVVDLARSRPRRTALVVVDASLNRNLVTTEELRQVTADCCRWPGIRRARTLVEFADAGAESPLESLARLLLADHGVPAPRTQVPISDGDGWTARVDFLWEAERVVGEADGLNKYADADVLRTEKLREEHLSELGYSVVRMTWHQVTREPERTAARVLSALRR
jgi:very-short-patch-repair endonuclease